LLSFDEVVQAGSGSLLLDAEGEIQKLSAERCLFAGHHVACQPEVLQPSSSYSVQVSANFMRGTDAHFQSVAPNLSTSFRTLALDLPPRLLRAGPFVGEEGAAKGSVIVLTFSEVVQAGEGQLEILHCEPFHSRFAAASDCLPGGVNFTIDVTSGAAIFEETSVFVVPPEELHQGRAYSLRLSNSTLFTDSMGQGLRGGLRDYSFRVVDDDVRPPKVYP
jgi:hypothetical protein